MRQTIKLHRHVCWCFVALGLLVGAVHAEASHRQPFSTTRLVQEAELIFQGVVVSVEYRLSDQASRAHVQLPHTFVTFEIEHMIKGHADQQRFLTLRFQGGDAGDGRFMMLPDGPLFDVGHRDILFVTGNGTRMCSLAGWSEGRLRIVDDAVYNDAGQETWVTSKNTFVFGNTQALPELTTRHIPGARLRSDTSIPPQQAWVAPAGAERRNAREVVETLRTLVQRLHTPEALARLRPVPGTRLQDPLYVYAPEPTPPPGNPATAARRHRGVAPQGGYDAEQDNTETELLRQNGGNPVFRTPRR